MTRYDMKKIKEISDNLNNVLNRKYEAKWIEEEQSAKIGALTFWIQQLNMEMIKV